MITNHISPRLEATQRRPFSAALRLPFAVTAVLAITLLAPSGREAAAQTPVRYLDCRSLAGAGAYANPLRVGAITQTTIVRNCPPLTSGTGFNVRYFSFSLPRTPSSGSYVMTMYNSATGSGVHPRLAWGASTVKGSLSSKYYRNGQTEGFYHSMADLWAGDAWRVGAEKLSSPLGSLQTAPYSVVFQP